MTGVNPDLRQRPLTHIVKKTVDEIKTYESNFRAIPAYFALTLTLIPEGKSKEEFLAGVDEAFEAISRKKKMPQGVDKVRLPEVKAFIHKNAGRFSQDNIKRLALGQPMPLGVMEKAPKIPTPSEVVIVEDVEEEAPRQRYERKNPKTKYKVKRPRGSSTDEVPIALAGIRNFTGHALFVGFEGDILLIKEEPFKGCQYVAPAPYLGTGSDDYKDQFYGELILSEEEE